MNKQVNKSRRAFMKKHDNYPGVKTFAVPFMTTKVKVYTLSPNSDSQSENGCWLCGGGCGGLCSESCWITCASELAINSQCNDCDYTGF